METSAASAEANGGADKTTAGDSNTDKETSGETEKETSAASDSTSAPLTKESSDSAVQTLITQYYTAVASRDYDTLSSIDATFDEAAKAAVEAESAIESYDNIVTYTKPGLTDGTYVAYIYFEAKITGIDTPAPSLREMYLVTDTDGNLKIGDKRSSQELVDYLLDCQRDSDVQALVKDVNQKLADAKAQDSALASYVDSIGTDADTADSDTQTSTAQTGTMKVSTGVNVRGEASPDATLYGTLSAGMEVEVLENLGQRLVKDPLHVQWNGRLKRILWRGSILRPQISNRIQVVADAAACFFLCIILECDRITNRLCPDRPDIFSEKFRRLCLPVSKRLFTIFTQGTCLARSNICRM